MSITQIVPSEDISFHTSIEIAHCRFEFVHADIHRAVASLEPEPVADPAYMRVVSLRDLKGGDKGMRTEEILKAADRLYCRPATLTELVVWARRHWNRTQCVVALGTVRGTIPKPSYPCVSTGDDDDGLYPPRPTFSLEEQWHDCAWGDYNRFLIIPHRAPLFTFPAA